MKKGAVPEAAAGEDEAIPSPMDLGVQSMIAAARDGNSDRLRQLLAVEGAKKLLTQVAKAQKTLTVGANAG